MLKELELYEEVEEELDIAMMLFDEQGRDDGVRGVEEFLKDLESL
ncbi:MAG: hypothetical protein SVK08_08500 [Halobacteriota archaeon]|nr:hypothetical protein [Halobacteriota archaeon]